VVTLRCTVKLLKQLDQPQQVATIGPATRLGDWYGTLLFTLPERLVLCVSEQTLLPVLLPAAPFSSLPARLPRAVSEVLTGLGADRTSTQEECEAMSPVVVGRTASRSVLGSLNDFVRMIDTRLEPGMSALQTALWLADTPCGPLQMESPRRATVALLQASS
jgi:uncharacterized protein DUF6933